MAATRAHSTRARPQLHRGVPPENDPLAEWIADECQLDPEHWTAARDLRTAYERWCENAGAKPLDGGRAWAAALKAHGCTRQRRHGGHGWQGITLTPLTRDPS